LRLVAPQPNLDLRPVAASWIIALHFLNDGGEVANAHDGPSSTLAVDECLQFPLAPEEYRALDGLDVSASEHAQNLGPVVAAERALHARPLLQCSLDLLNGRNSNIVFGRGN
jgi:hypothetical protein